LLESWTWSWTPSSLVKELFEFLCWFCFFLSPNIAYYCTGNIGNVPLVLLSALCRDPSNPFGDSEKCTKDGTAYISFGQWVGSESCSLLHLVLVADILFIHL